MKNTKKTLLKMVYISLFTALCFVGTFVHINFGPAIGMLHLGNFVGIIAALLFGGVIGGIAGSLGMGLYDIVYGYPWDTVVRTFVVKFVAFFIIGILFKYLNNKENKNKYTPLLFFVTFLILGGGTLTTYILTDNEKLKTVLVITGAIMMLTFAFYYLVVFFIKDKFNKIMYDVLIATSLGIIIQIFLEFILRIILQMIIGVDFNVALIASIVKLPTALVNGTITIILIQLFFMPVYLATKSLIKLKGK